MKTIALIYGTTEQEQTVRIEFEYIPVRKWFGDASTIFVNFCHVMDSLNFKPSDIITDVEVAIAQAIGEKPQDIRIECEVKHSVKPVTVIQISPSYETEMLFI